MQLIFIKSYIFSQTLRLVVPVYRFHPRPTPRSHSVQALIESLLDSFIFIYFIYIQHASIEQLTLGKATLVFVQLCKTAVKLQINHGSVFNY